MSKVIVVATFKLREGAQDDAIAALTPVFEGSHQEEGCLSYALHRSKQDPLTLVIVERWASQEALDAHFTKPYVAELGAKAGDLVSEPPSILFLDPVALGDADKGVL